MEVPQKMYIFLNLMKYPGEMFKIWSYFIYNLFEISKVTFSSYTFIFSRYYNECAGIYVSVDKDHGIHKTVEKIKLRENGKSNFGFGFLGCMN